MAKYRVVKLADIKSNFFVRKAINQDHVLMLAELYEAALIEAKGDHVAASKAITAIQVTDDGILGDGRHRKEAMELAGLLEARVEILENMTNSQLIVMATKANYGGSLPPSREDLIFTVEQLLTKFNMTQKQVEESMVMLPKSVIRKYINQANKRIHETRVKLALSDISSGGLSAAQAAKRHDLKLEAVQVALEGKKPKSKLGAAQVTGALTQQAKSFTNSTTRLVTKAIQEFQDGEIPYDVAQQAINHFGHLLRRMFMRAEDWNNRLRAIKSGETLPPFERTDNINREELSNPKKGAVK